MQVSATIHVLQCTGSRDNLHLIYTMEKQANNYHKTKTRNTKSATYRGADKSLARPWKERSYSDQDSQHYTNTYGVQITGIYSCCLHAISLGIVL